MFAYLFYDIFVPQAGFSEHLSKFIATQGPLSETFMDFWEMVMQYNCPAIVMLTAVDNPKVANHVNFS